MATQSLGNPQITGNTPDELRKSTQFWMQQLFNHVDKITGVRGTPTIFSNFDANGNAIQNLKAGVNPQDAVIKAQALTLEADPHTGEEQYDATNIAIINVPAGEAQTDAVNVGQLDSAIQDAIAASLATLFANPTAQVGPVAINGALSTAMRSDAAPKLADTAVVAGAYTNANITVDAQGRITLAALVSSRLWRLRVFVYDYT